jgi:hypothetical protein
VCAGTIGYRVFQFGAIIDEGTRTVSNIAPYTNIEIPLGTLTVNTDVHIFDIVNGSDPADSVGMITLRGVVPSPIMPVRVLVADQSLTDNGGPVDDGFHQGPLPVFPASEISAAYRSCHRPTIPIKAT